jgi:hypothetical protein
MTAPGIDHSAPLAGPLASRDMRVDVLRGLALGVMLVDHVPGAVLADLTPHNFGAADVADLFVFLSGLVAGKATSRRLARDGWWPAQRRVLWRATVIYLAIVATLGVLLGVERLHQRLFGWPIDLLDRSGEAVVRAVDVAVTPEAGSSLGRQVLLLQHPLGNLSILLLYLTFIPLTPLVLGMMRAAPARILFAAVPVYLCAQLWPDVWSWPAAYRETGALNPCGWQLPYFLGVVLGATAAGPQRRTNAAPAARFVRLPGRVLAGFGALVILEGIFLWKLLDPGTFQYAALKSNLAPLRLVNLAAWVLLVDVLAPRESPVWSARGLAPLRICGRRPLLVYCSGVVLSAWLHVGLATFQQAPWLEFLAILSGWGLLVVVAWGADRTTSLCRLLMQR